MLFFLKYKILRCFLRNTELVPSPALTMTAGYTDLDFQEKLTLIPQEPTKIPQEPPKTDSCGSGAIVSRGRCATTNLTVVRFRTVSYIPKIDFNSTQVD